MQYIPNTPHYEKTPMGYQSQMLVTQHVDDAYQRGFQIGMTIGMLCATVGCAVGIVIFTYVKG